MYKCVKSPFKKKEFVSHVCGILKVNSTTEQLHFKNESCICWDDWWITALAICVVWCAGQPGNLANTHLWTETILSQNILLDKDDAGIAKKKKKQTVSDPQ